MARITTTSGTKALRIAMCAGFALAMIGCSPDRAPRAVNQAPTIVSLNPCLDAILVEIAEPDQVLALSHYSRDPGSSSIPQDVAARPAQGVLAVDRADTADHPVASLHRSGQRDRCQALLAQPGLAAALVGEPQTAVLRGPGSAPP